MVIPLLGRRLARQPSPLQTRAARCGQTIQGRRFGNPEFRIDYAHRTASRNVAGSSGDDAADGPGGG
ncbi:MAG TPA: hypothetical protein PKL62_14905 [Accumulibacter sp.]|nr:hypothetical protein [Accumulibacter sp.]